MTVDVEWTHKHGSIQMGVVRRPEGLAAFRIQDQITGQSFDLRGCQQARFIYELGDNTVIAARQLFALGEQLISHGCTCNREQCDARTEALIRSGK